MRLFCFIQQINLIKYKERAHAIGFAGCQKTVDEGCGRNRVVYGHDERHLVYIGSQDMALFAEVGGAADDIIAPLLYLRDPEAGFTAFDFRLLTFYFYIVSHSHRVGGTNTTNAEIAFDMAFHTRTIVQTDDVTATR